MSNKKEAKKHSSNTPKQPTGKKEINFVFKRENYILTLACLVVLAIGFALMSGSEGDIYDFRRTTLAPIVVLLGFGIGVLAIFYTPKSKAE